MANNNIAVVTGGSRGIGRSTVLSLAGRGVDSIFTYRINREEADKVVDLVADRGARAIALQLDMGNIGTFGDFAETVRSTLTELGAERFDYLVNNAGPSSNVGLEKATEADVDAQYNVHFKGVLFLTQKLLPLLNDGGRIVNISSALARVASRNRIAYGPMKAAVESLTRYMALELGPRRITANIVAPGATATDFSGGIVRDNPEMHKLIVDNTALGRVGLPDDIGQVIAAVLSDDFGWVNAQRIEAAGGVVM
jgi:NAD(P)-dependent dehydrogenase (short-subunit alcohol dehydrogenase family)